MPDFLAVNDKIDVYEKTWKFCGITDWRVTVTLNKTDFGNQIKQEILVEIDESLDKLYNPPPPAKRREASRLRGNDGRIEKHK